MEHTRGKSGEHKCFGVCGCGKSFWYYVVKVFLLVVVISFFVILGMGVGVGMTRGNMMSGWGERAGGLKFGATSDRLGCPMVQGTNVKYFGGEKGWGSDKSDLVRLFGVIVKVEGNKVTVKDNAALEQVVLSQADTVIATASAEMGISDLKVGDKTVTVGTYDESKQLVAKMISVQ